MTTPARDPVLLAQVKPHQLVSYLRDRQWEKDRPGETSETWTFSESDETFEVLVPLDRTLRDYPHRIADVLNTLQALEGRAKLQVLSDLLSLED